MNKIVTTALFDRKFKKFIKKFPSLANDILKLQTELIENPEIGIHLTTYLGSKIFKIRLASKSKGKGKSGGFRIITYVVKEKDDDIIINLITIFDKSEESNILKSHLLAILKSIFG